jgi:hypothetical protein
MARFLIISLLLFAIFNLSHAFRVLTLATNVGFSHLEFTGRVSDILVDVGHDVDYVLTVWNPALKYNGTKRANLIRYEGKNIDKLSKAFANMCVWKDAFNAEWDNQQMKRFGQVIAIHCEGCIRHIFLKATFRHSH